MMARLVALLLACFGTIAVVMAQPVDPLSSWSDGAARSAMTGFVARVPRDGGPEFVPPAERIAVFDNDGTLWCEQPMYFQATFGLDQVKAMAPQHPEWKQRQPFKAFLANDEAALAAQGEKGLLTLLAVAHSGMPTDTWDEAVRRGWAVVDTAKHWKTVFAFERATTGCRDKDAADEFGDGVNGNHEKQKRYDNV